MLIKRPMTLRSVMTDKSLFKRIFNKLDKEINSRIDAEAIKESVRSTYDDTVQQTSVTARDIYQLARNRRVRLAVTGLSRSGKSEKTWQLGCQR